MAGTRSTLSALGAASAGALALALIPQAAQAASPAIAVQIAEMVSQDCAAIEPASTPILGVAQAPSKAAQIIGGQSALDAIRMQQASAPASHPLFSSAPAKPFEPAAAPSPQRAIGCAIDASPFTISGPVDAGRVAFAAPRFENSLVAAASRKDLILGSRMVPITRTSFDAQWQRLGKRRTDLSATLARIPGRQSGRAGLVASVNSWVNREIGHAEDRELFGRSDYWADAATTLSLGKGDCEDFALLKMELLAAAGVSRDDMVLTLARDLIRRRDHAVLLVRDGDGWLMLDNVGSAPLDASLAHGYRPVMSLGAKQSWLHGY